MMDINEHLLHCFTDFLIKKTLVGAVKNEVICYEELAEELSKPSIRKFEKRNVYSPFMDNILGADFKGVIFFLCVIDIYRKYV